MVNIVSCTFQVDIDFEKEPIGIGKDGKEVYFRDIWPSTEEIAQVHYVLKLCCLSVICTQFSVVTFVIIIYTGELSVSIYFVAIMVTKMVPNRLSNLVCCLTCSRAPMRLSRKATQCGTS